MRGLLIKMNQKKKKKKPLLRQHPICRKRGHLYIKIGWIAGVDLPDREGSRCVFLGQMVWKIPTKLRRYLEAEKWRRQLHVINGLAYYRVAHSQDGTGWVTSGSICCCHWDNFIVNLGYGGTCSETGSAFLKQDLQMGNQSHGRQEYVSKDLHHCLENNSTEASWT